MTESPSTLAPVGSATGRRSVPPPRSIGGGCPLPGHAPAAFDPSTLVAGVGQDQELEDLAHLLSGAEVLWHLRKLIGPEERAGAERPVDVVEDQPASWCQEPIDEEKKFRLGNLHIDTRLTWGHSPGGMTYVVTALAHPIAIVGDSLFAGSMGGGNVSYRDALQNNLQKVLTLPDETIICPGHGPMTSVAEEKQHNPFFAGKV